VSEDGLTRIDEIVVGTPEWQHSWQHQRAVATPPAPLPITNTVSFDYAVRWIHGNDLMPEGTSRDQTDPAWGTAAAAGPAGRVGWHGLMSWNKQNEASRDRLGLRVRQVLWGTLAWLAVWGLLHRWDRQTRKVTSDRLARPVLLVRPALRDLPVRPVRPAHPGVCGGHWLFEPPVKR
jgi:hypothetical protein